MRTVSLSSRLQWAFRGTVLQGALATGDVDNDGCNEFVVGSVQGELAVFRGRGGCGTWKHSETQVEPEYDCWDAVARGEVPTEPAAPRGEFGSLRRQSTYASTAYSAASTRELLSVDEIMHMFGGGDRPAGDAADDEASGPRRTSLTWNDAAECKGRVKWEDVLDIERDGRKPWILAQNLGTISSVVVADISNSGHNSIVVVNGEGKCHVFDYPFKRRFHPNIAKRRRQQNHLRRFSQDRFFKEGVVAETQEDEPDQEGGIQRFPPQTGGLAAIASAAPTGSDVGSAALPRPADSNPGSLGRGQGLRVRSALSSALAEAAGHNTSLHQDHSANGSSPALRASMSTASQLEAALSQSAGAAALQRFAARDTALAAPSASGADGSKPVSASVHSGAEFSAPKASWRPLSGVDGPPHDGGASLAPDYGMAPASNVSSQADPPLAMFDSRAYRAAGPTAHADGGALPEIGRIPTSPLGSHANTASRQGGFSAETGSSSHRRNAAVEAGMEAIGTVFGDAYVESDMDSTDDMSDSGDMNWLTADEVADIEKIWGADVGKRSGDWFPYVLEGPDATFDIPTNVEHALVADINNNGLNELVLTSTDGFVYIFRIEPAVKHVLKPALTPLGTFSNIPTALSSVNITTTGSPYLYMSAPRSPDASDLELDDSSKAPRAAPAISATAAVARGSNSKQPSRTHSEAQLQEGGMQTPPMGTPALPALSEVASEPAVVASVAAAAAAASDGGKANQLPRVMDAGPLELERLADDAGLLAPRETAPGRSTPDPRHAAAIVPQTPAQQHALGKRASLTSRMRESFSYIVSGSEAPRKPGPMFNQTAPSSLNHSRAATANNSGSSTNAHSRRPSSIDAVANAGLLDSSLGGLAAEHEAYRHSLKAPSVVQSSPVVVTSETQSPRRGGRPRNNTVSVDYRDMAAATSSGQAGMTDAAGGDLPPILESLSGLGALQQSPVALSAQHRPAPDSSPHSKAALHESSRAAAPEDSSQTGGLLPPRPPGSRQSSRAHSRHNSISSAVARLRALSGASTDADREPNAEGVQLGAGGSRRESAGSDWSMFECNANFDSNTSQAAAPLRTAARAQGCFSKPHRAQQPATTHADTADDSASLISQVTERLEGLSFRSKERRTAGPRGRPNPTSSEARPKRGNTLVERLESDAGLLLPPARTVVDWPSTTADKVATWFLDNIPGSVSVVNAPMGTFGEPLVSQQQIAYTDDSSACSCSSCSCSLCDSDEEGCCSSESIIDRMMGARPARAAGTAAAAATTTTSKYMLVPDPRTTAAEAGAGGAQSAAPFRYGLLARSMVTHGSGSAAAHSGLNLPQPLDLSAIGSDAGDHGADAVAAARPGEGGGRMVADSSGSVAHSAPNPLYAKCDSDDAASSQGGSDDQRPWPQRFLILSKPGGRFVPIDMGRGAILPTVEPPVVLMATQTGGNTSNLMNVDASGSQQSFQMSRISGLPLNQYSAMDLTATTGSYLCQSPSWQSSSIPWVHAIPGMSFNSAGALTNSPVPLTSADMSKPPAQLPLHAHVSQPMHLATSVSLASQFPVGEPLPGGAGSPARSLQGEPAAANPESDPRRLTAGISYSSVVKPGSASGATSISSNLRSQRNLHRTSFEALRAQAPAARHGLSPVYRGTGTSGAMTPGPGGYLFGASQLDRRQLGVAGLRGYIGGSSRQRASGRPPTGFHGEDGGQLSGHYSPLATGQLTARGHSFIINQGLNSGTMPREPTPGYFSPALPATTISASTDRQARLWLESIRHSPHHQRNALVTPAPASVSPQPGQQHQPRHSPSLMAWSSFKDGGILSTIKDSDDISEGRERAAAQRRPNSATPACVATNAQLPEPLGRDPSVGAFGEGSSAAAAERVFWASAELPSARSHSSLGTGVSVGQVPIVEREEEIEEAPQPMELDVATYMVGGVTRGARHTSRAEDRRGADVADHEADSEDEAGELVSLVTMEGTISCYDPARKINHYVNLNAKDPVLGIWKVQMHQEISSPSPLVAVLRDERVAPDSHLGRCLLASTPDTQVRRRVGLSHRSLLDAVQYATYVEDGVQLLNRLDGGLRRYGRRSTAAMRRLRQVSYGASGERVVLEGVRRDGPSPKGSRGNTMARLGRAGLSSRLLENLNRHHRGSLAAHSISSSVRDLPTGTSTQPSASDLAAAMMGAPSQTGAEDESSHRGPSDADTVNMSFSAAGRKPSVGWQAPSEPAARNGGRPEGDGGDAEEPASGPAGVGGSGGSSSNPATGLSLSQLDRMQLQRAINKDVAAALVGWYGRNEGGSQLATSRVSDHLIVSTWRGTTYFIDVGTLMDIARYDDRFTQQWNASTTRASENAFASLSSEKDGSSLMDIQSGGLSLIYSFADAFSDVGNLMSRLRANASVIQFKFQDTVSAFLADTYAPATGGPNVPCMFYVDYKDRIWAYYHLDNIAEMDDVYGATWLRGERERLQVTRPKAGPRAGAKSEDGESAAARDRPFSVVDMAYRRMTLDPWTPLPDDSPFQTLIACGSLNYPYSSKMWRRTSGNRRSGGAASATDGPNSKPRSSGDADDSQRRQSVGPRGSEASGTSSDNSMPAHLQHANANVTGSYHLSFLPGPYMCPVWSDINSVDLYDLGACNLLELVMPELLAVKHVFCKALDINPDSIDDTTSLATVPGLANWVRSHLYAA